MFPIINVGPVAIQAAGLILLISLWIGIWLSGIFAKRIGTNGEVIENSILIGLIAGLFGARLGFILQNPSVFMNNPLSLFSLTASMLDVSFGVLTGGLSAFIFAQKKHLPLWPTLDTLVPLFILIFTGLHFSNFATGNAFGLPTELPWGIQLWNAVRHPVQLYAVLLSLALLLWVFFHTHHFRTTGFLHSGSLFYIILAALSAITLFTRAFVAEKILLAGLDMLQLLGFLILSGSLALLYAKTFQTYQRIPVLISMGSNVDPEENISIGLEKIKLEFNLRRSSSTYQSEDIANETNTPEYLNKVIEIETNLPFSELVTQLKSIERDLGRTSGDKSNVPLDLDILTYNDDVFNDHGYQIPSPDLLTYRHIALPLAELAPDFRHPAKGLTIQTILDMLKDQSQVVKIEKVENGIKE